MVGTDPFTRVSIKAKPALYWPSLLKQFDVKWLAHTNKVTRTVAGTLSFCLFCSSVARTEYRHLCWFIQPTTEQFACLALSDNIAKHCYLTATHTKLHFEDKRPCSCRYVMTGAESGQPVGAPFYQWVGCRDHAGLILGVSRLMEDELRGQRKRVFYNMRPKYTLYGEL